MARTTSPAKPAFKRDVEFCGALFDGEKLCHRLPMHHSADKRTGDPLPFDGHAEYVIGNGVKAPKAAKAAPGKADRVVTRGGVKYVEKVGKGGVITLRPVATELPVARPKAATPSTKRVTRRPAKAAAKVTTLPEAPARRRVAAPSKTARRVRR